MPDVFFKRKIIACFLILLVLSVAFRTDAATTATTKKPLLASVWSSIIDPISDFLLPLFVQTPSQTVTVTKNEASAIKPKTAPGSTVLKVTQPSAAQGSTGISRAEFETRLGLLDAKIKGSTLTASSTISKEEVIDLIQGSQSHNSYSLGTGISSAIQDITNGATFFSPTITGTVTVTGGETTITGKAVAPALLSHVTDNTYLAQAYRIAVQGAYAYIASVSSGMTIYNISDPQNPVFASNVSGGAPEDIAVSGNYAYLAGFAGLRVFDVSNPLSPKLIFSNSTTGCIKDFKIQGKYLYVTYCGSIFGGGFQIYDISNPYSPRSMSFLSSAYTTGEHPAIQGNYMYGLTSAFGSSGFYIMDISNPRSPTIVNASSSPSGASYASAAVISGKYVYTIGSGASDTSYNIQIFDVSSTTAPTLVKKITRSSPGFGDVNLATHQGISIRGNLLYVSGKRYTDLAIIDVSNPSNPTLVSYGMSGATATESATYTTHTIQGNYLYEASWVGSSGGSFSVVDISGLTVSNLEAGSLSSSNITVNNDLAVIGNASVTGGVMAASGLFSNGVGIYSSSTLAAALTVTGTTYMNGSLGIGSTTPWAKLSINPGATDGFPMFVVGSSTATHFIIASTTGFVGSGTSTPWGRLSINPLASDGLAPSFIIGSSTGTMFVVDNAGNVGIGTTSPFAKLSVVGQVVAASFTATTTATSTFGGGINLTSGCFAVAGTCLGSGGGAGSGTINSGTTGQLAYYASDGTAVSATSSLFLSSSSNFGVGSSSPFGKFSVQTSLANDGIYLKGGSSSNNVAFRIYNDAGIFNNIFTGRSGNTAIAGKLVFNVNSDATTAMVIDTSGYVGIGTTTPNSKLDLFTSDTNNVLLHLTGSGRDIGIQTGESLQIGHWDGSTYTERFKILDTGSIGIGTSSPGSLFSVSASTANSGFYSAPVTISNTNTGSFMNVINAYAPNLTAGQNSCFNVGVNNGNNNLSSFCFNYAGNGSANNSFNVYLAAQTTPGLTVQGTGNVGVGTTTPWAKLSLNNYSSGASTMPLFVVSSSTGSLATSTQFIINSIGNVGIGTTTPTKSLSISRTDGDMLNLYRTSVGQAYHIGIASDSGFFLNNETTGGTTLFKVTSTGNIGIGTTVPSTKLHIQQTDVVSTREYLQNLSLSTDPNTIGGFVNGTSLDNTFGPTFYGYRNGATNKFVNQIWSNISSNGDVATYEPLIQFNGAVTSNASDPLNGTLSSITNRNLLAVSNNGSQLLSVSASGNLGIGSTTPLAFTQARKALVLQDTTNDVSIRMVGSNSIDFELFTNGVSAGAVTRSAHPFVISTSNTERVRVDASGNVSIGTTTTNRARLALSGTDSAGYVATLHLNNLNSSGANAFIASSDTFWSAGSNKLFFGIGGDPLSANVKMTIDGATGNVGIATTSPWRTLSVVGTMSVNGLSSSAVGNAVCITANNEITTASAAACNGVSSQRFKHDITTADLGLSTILSLRPVTFRYNQGFGDSGRDQQFGLIAEEAYAVDSRLAILDDQGLPTTVRYDFLAPILVKAVQDLNIKIDGFASTTALLGSSTQSSIFESFVAYLADKVLAVKTLVAHMLTVDKLKVQEGIEMTDAATGAVYCVTIRNGDWDKSAGNCGSDANNTQTPPPVVEDSTPDSVQDTSTTTPPVEVPSEEVVGSTTPSETVDNVSTDPLPTGDSIQTPQQEPVLGALSGETGAE